VSEVCLHNRLLEHRTRQGLTQAALADAVGVSRKTVNTIENRVFVPSTVLALRLAACLGTTVEELFWLEDESGP
jgi:putative transcriptional regulator